jgi:hypothetical protein
MLRGQRQIHQRAHRTLGAQQRIGQLKPRVSPRTQAAVERISKSTHLGQ